MNPIKAARAPKGYDAQRISRRRVPRRTGTALIASALLLAFILLTRSSPTTAATTDGCYQVAAQKSLAKLCSTYDCPPSAEPNQNYAESALSQIYFLTQEQFVEVVGGDDNDPREKAAAYTIKDGRWSWIYVNLETFKDVRSEARCQVVEEVLDHEVIHQAAVLQVFPEPLTLNFFNRSFVAVGSIGLSLLDNQSVIALHYVDEAYTEWLALSGLRRSSPSDSALIYQRGPKVVDVLNAKMGLKAKTVFDLYVNRGLYGFVPYFAKLSGPDLVKEYRSEEQSGLALLFYTDLILSDVAQGAYSEGEALRRIFEFTDSPNVSVRNR